MEKNIETEIEKKNESDFIEVPQLTNQSNKSNQIKNNYRLNYSNEFKEYAERSKFNINLRFNAFLNYIKSKKGDESGIYLKNNLLDLDFPIEKDGEIFSSLKLMKQLDILKDEENISLLIDLHNFVDNSNYNYGPINSNLLDSYLLKMKNLGTIILFADMPSVASLEIYFKEKMEKLTNVNYLIKSVLVHKTPLLSFVSIQKFELKTSASFDKIKIHLAEFYDINSLGIAKINDLFFSEFSRVYSYLFNIQQISAYLKNVFILF